MTRPQVLPVLTEGVPCSLRESNRWVMWRLVERAKAWAKMPMTVEGRAASSTDPKTWTTYEAACDALIFEDGFSGIGFVLGDGLHGIDLDDCRDAVSGELSALAIETLERVGGYAEVSPSGTGIKLFARTDMEGSRAKKLEDGSGVELYDGGRYFTVTGHQLNGHGDVPGEVQELGWLVQRIWGEVGEVGEVGERALSLYKAPLEGWDLQRVVSEVLVHLDPDCGYDEWLKVGAALHHQSGGVGVDWLTAWDDWSAGSGKWSEGHCLEKWNSFGKGGVRSRGAVTLASLLAATKGARDVGRGSMMATLMDMVDGVSDVNDLQEQVAAKAAHNADLSDIDRAKLATAIQLKARALGVRIEIGTVRGWLRLRVKASFPNVNEDGHPLCTMGNLEVLLERLGVVVRYNVISKTVEVLIPGAAFSRDNRDNASVAYILSECEKARMSTRHVVPFLLAVADANLYNPVQVWVQSAEWDGVSRLEDFYSTVDCGGMMSAELKNLLMRKWLIQAIGAAFEPDGISAQGLLTFTGAQNIGKTTWFSRLAPENLVHTGHTLDVKSKDSQLIALKYWIVELGEIDATFKKSEISALKSWATQAVDNIRRPYAVSESSYGRRTVFGASVNEEQFLADPTGNRRFWTIPAASFVLGHTINMQQLWAEVFALWSAGERWYLTMGETEILGNHNANFTLSDPIEERIADGFAWESDTKTWVWMTATAVLIHCGFREPTRYQATSASRFIKKLNGDRRKRTGGRVLFSVPGHHSDFLE